MTLQEYINNLQELITENPKLKDATVVYSRDDEGNGFFEVGYTPSAGYFDGDYGGSFITSEDKESWNDCELTDNDINSVCIN